MQITPLGHAAVLVELLGKRILLDPGNFSSAWHALTNLDAVLITHQHPDHLDPEHIHDLLRANPDALVKGDGQALAQVEMAGAEELAPGETWQLGEVLIEAHGGKHAIIHADLPAISNVGFVISAEDKPRFFHPGDALDAIPENIDVVAIPTYGPWAAMKETVEFVRAVGAPQGFMIHEGLLNQRGINLITSRINELTDTAVVEVETGQSFTV